MIKTYKCRLSAANILVNVGGKIRHVEFEHGILRPTGFVGCTFTTGNKELQKAIEAHKWFNSKNPKETFWTDDVEEPQEAEAPIVKRTKKNKQ